MAFSLKQLGTWVRLASRELFAESGKNAPLSEIRLFGILFAILVTSVYLALACWTVIEEKQPLDYVAFGTGISAVWAVVSAAVVFKAHVENQGNSNG